MKGIILKEVIKQFGFKDGFSFWFRWSFVNPVQMWIWLNITHKPYCTYSGFHCHKENCTYKHLHTKQEIEEHWTKSKKEMERVKKGPKGECVYCGEEKGTEIIDDPNLDTLERWKVCKICEEVINLQMEITFPLTPIKRQQEINDRLLQIAKETGKSIMTTKIIKDKDDKYHSSSVTFTGEKDV